VRQQITDEIRPRLEQKTDQVHAAHILVETEEEAQQVLDRLAQGEQFEALASELSKDTGTAANGGDLGWVQKGQTVPEFEKAIFEDLKPGEITETPVQTQFGYHIIKVIERGERASITEEEAAQLIESNIEAQLRNQRQQALQQLIEEERAKARNEGRLVEPDYPDPTALPTVPPEPSAPTAAPAAPEPTAAP
jgi:parvulin-like peptidyl-prolyl isomerase